MLRLNADIATCLENTGNGSGGQLENKSLTKKKAVSILRVKQQTNRVAHIPELTLRRTMEMKVKPLGDRVLVKMSEMDEKTAGGIFIPQTAQEKTQQGIVLAVGDDEAIKVKVNDRVIYDKYAGTTFKVGGEEQLILKNSDILAKIE
jgi:chaperonin GroES